jgi:hypothetical protein
MSDLLQRVGELKTQAKNRRDLKRYDRAGVLLKQAIDLACKEYESTSLPDRRAILASELADCWGILGGVERRWALDPSSDEAQRTAHLRQSIAAYDKGYCYESDPLLDSTTKTYNRLNRLVSRLLLNPERLTANGNAADQEPNGTLNVRSELEAIATQIKEQGIDSVWTAADLALLNVLLGRQDAASAYASFEKKQPPDFAYQSALDVVAPLAALNLATAAELKSAEKRLTMLGARRRSERA